MSVTTQEQALLKRGLLKRKQPATAIANRIGYSRPQQIATALHNLVRDGQAVRHSDSQYSRV